MWTGTARNEDIVLHNDDEAAIRGDADVVKKDNAESLTVNASLEIVDDKTQEEKPIAELTQPTVQNKRSRGAYCSRICTAIILFLLIVIIWLLFALPTVFYGLRLLKEVGAQST